jgi:hypothetical protein
MSTSEEPRQPRHVPILALEELRRRVSALDFEELRRRIDPTSSPEYQERFAELMDGIVPLAELLQPARPEPPDAPAPAVTPTPRPKRSTEPGEARAKLIAALTKHHRYADGSCLNTEPIGNNELARLAGVSESTASAFFNDKFRGHAKYKVLCRDPRKLTAALKLLNDEFAPYYLLGNASSELAAPEEDDADSE